MHGSLLVLGPYELSLLRLFLFVEHYGVFDLLLLGLSSCLLLEDALPVLLDFLLLKGLLLKLCLNFLFVFLFKASNIRGSLFGLLDLFPGLHFFLLEQSDSVGE